MRGVALPAALLCAALGLLLAFAQRRGLLPSLIALCLTAVLSSLFPFPTNTAEVAFAGCWISIILLAAAVHCPRWLNAPVAVAMAAVAAVVHCLGPRAGMLISVEGARPDLVRALPAVLIMVPGRWFVGRGWQIAVKVVSSWLIAVSLLAALLPASPTPGYIPDHMD